MYFAIHDWMMNGMQLRGCELLVYSVIYRYSADMPNTFFGGRDFVVDKLGFSKPTAIAAFHSLEEKGFIQQVPNPTGGRTLCYVVTDAYKEYELESVQGNMCEGKEISQGVKKLYREGKETLPNEGKESLPFKGKETLPNNRVYIRENIKEKNNNNPLTPLPYEGEEFVQTWAILVKQPKWKGKSKDALAAQAKFLAGYPESVAVKMMNNSIRNGWQGLFPLKAEDEKQQKERLINAVGRVRASVLRQVKEMGLTRQEIVEGYGEDYAEDMDKYGHLI